jgi:hypothetical protein
VVGIAAIATAFRLGGQILPCIVAKVARPRVNTIMMLAKILGFVLGRTVFGVTVVASAVSVAFGTVASAGTCDSRYATESDRIFCSCSLARILREFGSA